MTAASRTKGQCGERELCKLLSQSLGLDLSRNLDQVREGGADILGVPGFIIEVKRREAEQKAKWWEQVCKAGRRYPQLMPVVAYRRSRQPWRFMLPLSALFDGAPCGEWLEVSYDGYIKFAERHSR